MSSRLRGPALRPLATAIVFVIGVVATVAVRHETEAREQRAEEALFGNAVSRVESRMRSELGRFEDLLLATAGTVLHGTNESGFRSFVQGIRLTERYPGAVGLAYVERQPGPPPAAVLRLVEPPPPLDVAGADILQLPEARAALATGPVATVRMTPRLYSLEPVLEVQAEQGALFSLFVPVGDPQQPMGWVGLPLVASDFTAWLTRGANDFVEVALYDGADPSLTNRLTPPPARHRRALRGVVRRENIYGRVWSLEVRQVAAGTGNQPAGPVTAMGLAASLVAALAVWVTLGAVSRRRQMVERLTFRALHDELTGLANRQELRSWLAGAIEASTRDHRSVALLYCDLDRFKVANDSLGHTVGDQLLVMVADRFRRTIREGDVVARLGGDEFAVGCKVADELEATVVAERVRSALREPFEVDGHEVFLTVSIGVALAIDDDVEQLIADADTAMYRAKDAGRARVSAVASGQRDAAHERLQLEAALHRATERGELRLHYQPVVDMATGYTVGCEALVRWQHPVLGLLGPDRFIGLAEETGLIVEIGDWVIETACNAWVAAGGQVPGVAVNLSARQLAEPDLGSRLADVLHASGMPAHLLTIEITETVLASAAAAEQAGALRSVGVRVAVDDFGTGYSSLASLRHLPVDVLKIDQRFVAGMGHDAVDDAIVEAVVGLAATLQLELIAEGVETEAQAFALRGAGCDLAQGYLFGRPEPTLPSSSLRAHGD